MNLAEWAHAQGIHATAAYCWYREGALPVPARTVGRLILVPPDTAAATSPQRRAGLYVRVSSHDLRLTWTARSAACRRGRRRPACLWSGSRPRSGPG